MNLMSSVYKKSDPSNSMNAGSICQVAYPQVNICLLIMIVGTYHKNILYLGIVYYNDTVNF